MVISSALLVRSECDVAEPEPAGEVGIEFVTGLADDGEQEQVRVAGGGEGKFVLRPGRGV